MKFKSGESGNPEGRTPGSVNKVTQDARNQIESILNKHFSSEQLAKDLKEMKPRERINMFLRLLEFVLPKQKAMELKLDFEVLSDQDLDKIINSLIQKADEEDRED